MAHVVMESGPSQEISCPHAFGSDTIVPCPPKILRTSYGRQRTYPASGTIAAARLGLSPLSAEYEAADSGG